MKKKANKRAFFVCVFICLIYASVAAKIPEKMSFVRTFGSHSSGSKNMGLVLHSETQKTANEVDSIKTIAAEQRVSKKPVQNTTIDDSLIEPSFFISVPLVCNALAERLIDREGLVLVDKDNGVWKKPLDILRDNDEEGLKNISKAMGANYILNFFKKEGIIIKDKLSEEEMILGKGYSVEKKKILSMYNSYVKDNCSRLFPFAVGGNGIVRLNGDYAFVQMKSDTKNQYSKHDKEWLMPNLINLPSKTALEKLVMHTSRIKVIGSGNIAEQYPRPFERVRGDAECVIYGRTYRQ